MSQAANTPATTNKHHEDVDEICSTAQKWVRNPDSIFFCRRTGEIESCELFISRTARITALRLISSDYERPLLSDKDTQGHCDKNRNMYRDSIRRSCRHGLVLTIASCLSLAMLDCITGFSTGAGGCGGGGPAVGGMHIDFLTAASAQDGMNATLFEAATVVWLDGVRFEPNMPTILPTGQDISFRIETFQVALRGFLIRVEAPDPDVDLTGTIASDSPLVQNAAACDQESGNVVGLTHTDASEKAIVNATLRLDHVAVNVTIGVTVVFINNANLSVFAYDNYTVSFGSNTLPPSATTSAIPLSPAPVQAPTTPAVSSPARAPIAASSGVSWISAASLIPIALTGIGIVWMV
jgi:hypothetical protein